MVYISGDEVVCGLGKMEGKQVVVKDDIDFRFALAQLNVIVTTRPSIFDLTIERHLLEGAGRLHWTIPIRLCTYRWHF
jgi:hypothetical protein